jgi:serine/threonine protein kinase
MRIVKRIQQYEVVRVLGGGGFGTVFEAVESGRPGERVAIKVLHKDLAAQPDVAQRFFNEALVLARLEHPAIPRVLSFGPWEGTYVLVQELVEGESLRAGLSRGRRSPTETVTLLGALLEALVYAHSRGVVHRDLKPENVMLTASGPRILDFGLAKILGGVRLSQSGAFLGSVPYASPEQLRGREVDARTDVFAIGVMLFELLTGRLPVQGGPPRSFSDVMDAQLSWADGADRDALRAALPDVPARLDAFFRTATAASPADRYPDAAAALAALSGAPAPTAAPARPPGGLDVRIEPCFSRTCFAADDDPAIQLLVELEVAAPPPGAALLPSVRADLVLVLDVSGSMDAPDRYPLLRRAVEELLHRMDPDDRVGIAVFSTDAEVITAPIPGAQASRDAASLLARMDRSGLKFGGATRLGPGLARALQTLRGAAPGAVRRVYVLTDGELHDTPVCERVLSSFRDHRVEAHVYGFGPAFDAAALKRLVSDQLGGSVKPICNEQDIVRTFSHIAEVNSRLVAEEGMLTLEIDAEVDAGDAWSFRPQERPLGRVRGRRIVRELGAVESGRVYATLVELRLPPAAPGAASTPVARARFVCRSGAARVEHEQALHAPRGEVSGEPAPRVEQAFAVLDALRKGDDREAQLRAARARLELARLDDRDPGLLAALQRQIEILEGKRPAGLGQADQQYLAADESSVVFPIAALKAGQ